MWFHILDVVFNIVVIVAIVAPLVWRLPSLPMLVRGAIILLGLAQLGSLLFATTRSLREVDRVLSAVAPGAPAAKIGDSAEILDIA